MDSYIVLYREPYQNPIEKPHGFQCMADNSDRAEEHCVNAYPDADVVWVSLAADMDSAVLEYWLSGCN